MSSIIKPVALVLMLAPLLLIGCVEATGKVAVGDRVAVADEFTGAALRVGSIHPLAVEAAGRAGAHGQSQDHGRDQA